jgi:hypothetical protein
MSFVLVLSTVVSLAFATGAGAAGRILDQQQTQTDAGTPRYSGIYVNGIRIGQTFTAGVSAPLVGISVRQWSKTASGTTAVELRATDAAGRPAGPVLASTTYAVVVAGNAWRSATFETPAWLVAGVKYALVVTGDPAVYTGFTGSISPDAYPAGEIWHWWNGQWQIPGNGAGGSGWDVGFQTFVGDETAPTLTVPADVTVEAGGPQTAVSYAATATDTQSTTTTSCAPASGSAFPLGSTTVTCTAQDAYGNVSAPQSFQVTVRDTTGPAWAAAPADVTAEATGGSGALVAYAAPAASDLVDGTVASVCSPASGSQFALGVTPVSCTATDAAGNASAPAVFTVTVRDTTAPVLAPAGVVAEATGPDGAAVAYAPTGDDLVDGTVAATCDPASGALFPLGTTTVSCSASDAAGNTAAASFAVTVRDTTAPSIVATAVTASGRAYVSGSWTNEDVVVTFSCSDTASGIVAGTCPAARTVSGETAGVDVADGVSDAAGNAATSNTITVRIDRTAPGVAFTGNAGSYDVDDTVTIGCTAADASSGVAADTCAAAALVSVSAASLGAGTHTLTATATDAAGNTTTASTSFTVVVTAAGLGAVATSFLESSAAFQALPARTQAAVTQATTAVISAVTAVLPRLKPAQQTAVLAALDATLARSVRDGFLTPSQAATLKSLVAGG